MLSNLEDFGKMLDEATIKKGLLELNPTLQFDPGGRLNMFHPEQTTRQGVWQNDRHLATMGRGAIPEFNVWGVVTEDGKKRKSHIVKVGWRHTFKSIVDKNVPGITWDALERKFRIKEMEYVGDNPPPMEMVV